MLRWDHVVHPLQLSFTPPTAHSSQEKQGEGTPSQITCDRCTQQTARWAEPGDVTASCLLDEGRTKSERQKGSARRCVERPARYPLPLAMCAKVLALLGLLSGGWAVCVCVRSKFREVSR